MLTQKRDESMLGGNGVRRGLLTLLATLVLLSIPALAVFVFEDDATLLQPPEAGAEGSVRQLAARRFTRALPFLADRLRSELASEDLRRCQEKLETRVGEIQDVRGKRGRAGSRRATATALAEATRSRAEIPFELVRQKGEWRIEELGAPQAPGRSNAARPLHSRDDGGRS